MMLQPPAPLACSTNAFESLLAGWLDGWLQFRDNRKLTIKVFKDSENCCGEQQPKSI